MPVVASGSASIPYRIRRSRRAKRLRIVVEPREVTAVAPHRVPEREIADFVASRAAWIAARRREMRRRYGTVLPARVETGARVLLRGERPEVVVRIGAAAGVRPGPRIEVVAPAATPPQRIEEEARRILAAWLRRQAAADAERYVERHAPRLGRWPTAIRVKDQKTRWGSCGVTGVVHLNWRLIGAPPEVFEYVVAHELCHLERRDHSPAFWRRLAGLLPRYERPRAWLRAHGLSLS